ncbi:hypothetical protein N7U49_48180 (plasmid) [Streptomyces sp. AD2-2]|nr:hypothetical protein N7U49_48180 [Streptomyces sp. AD2-2]
MAAAIPLRPFLLLALQDAGQVGVEVSDGNRDAVLEEALGKEFDQGAGAFPD